MGTGDGERRRGRRLPLSPSPLERVLTLPEPVDLALTLGPHRRGREDPATQLGAAGFWRATRTPEGPATLALVGRGGASRTNSATFDARAWGPGAEWALEHSPALVGAHDDPQAFRTDHPLIARLQHRFAGLRISRSNAVFETLIPTVLEQRVTGFESRRAYRQLVTRLGEPAPGPAGLMLPPDPATIAGTPYYDLHLIGVERNRADTLRRVAARAQRLEALLHLPSVEAQRELTNIRGLGPWSAGEVAMLAFGDPDAVSIGDYHIPHQVTFALTGEPRGSDDRMLELLEPFRGHRGRVIRLITAAGLGPERRGPRLGLNDFRDR